MYRSKRLKHFTFLWFLLPLSSGGLAGLLAVQTHTFRGLMAISKLTDVFSIVVFVAVTALSIYRFARWPETFMKALRNPGELLFVPAIVLSTEGIVTNAQQLGGPATGTWLYTAVYVYFWIYLALALLCAVGIYYYLFTVSVWRGNRMHDSQEAKRPI